jgi:hypothetical protein
MCPIASRQEQLRTISYVKRRLFNVLAGVSLVLCALVVVFWIHSRSGIEDFSIRRNDSLELWVSRGQFGISLTIAMNRSDEPRWSFFHWSMDGQGWDRPANFLGFARFEDTSKQKSMFGPDVGHERGFVGPTVFLAAAAAMLPAMWVIRNVKRRKWRQSGFCAACGYDLRATPDRCPECGTIPAKTIKVET